MNTIVSPRTSHRDRIRAAATVTWHAGTEAVGSLIALAQDRLAPAHHRQSAAAILLSWKAGDRTALASILGDLAGCPGTPPAARHQAARTLAQLGGSFRHEATTHLSTITNDPDVPAPVRAAAAKSLTGIHPRFLPASVDALRTIVGATTTKQAWRIHACTVLGSFTRAHCDEAVATLREIALHHDQSAPVRWRATHAMVGLRRDTAGEAALIVSGIVRDTTLPWHVRRRAARDLARWSPLCRDEARDFLVRHP
jgi:uncharacterized protein (UPF0147 family)